MFCDICGKDGTRIRKASRTYGKGENFIVIHNVPVVSCSNCGESYLTVETLHEIERIKLHRKSFSAEQCVKVANFT